MDKILVRYSLKISKFTRIYLKNYSAMTGRQEFFFANKSFQFLVAVTGYSNYYCLLKYMAENLQVTCIPF